MICVIPKKICFYCPAFILFVSLITALGFVCPSFAVTSDLNNKIWSVSVQIIKGYKSAESLPKERIAVVGFTTLDDRPCKLGNLIADKLTTYLSQNNRFELISRTTVRQVTEKHIHATYQQLGKQLGASSIITGVITDMGAFKDINAWLIRCDKQETILCAASAVIKMDHLEVTAKLDNSRPHKEKVPLKWEWLETHGLIEKTDELNEIFNLPQKVLHKGSGIIMVLIQPGRFLMGSSSKMDGHTKKMSQSASSRLKKGLDQFEWERPQHEVVISKPFYMGQCEVTNKQFRTVFASHNSGSKYGKGLNDDHQPVVDVTRFEAEKFCKQYSMRLPTEAEWEYCCRAGTTTQYNWGDKPEDGKNYGNVRDLDYASEIKNAGQIFRFSDGYVVSASVGSFRPNAFGLYDMHGNVWEWCQDGFQPDFYKQKKKNIDPLCQSREFGSVLRGGSWAEGPQNVRSPHRFWCGENMSRFDRGFRVVLEIPADVFVNSEKVSADLPKVQVKASKPDIKMPKSAVEARLAKIAPLFDELKRLKNVGNPQWKIVNRNMFVALKYALYDYPYSAEVYYYYARAYYLHGNWKGATKCLIKAFYYEPNYLDALVFKGDMNYDYGKKTGWYVTSRLRLDHRAREAYESAANLSDDNRFRAMMYLKIGNVYADLSRNKKKAKIYWKRSISTAPNSKAASMADKKL